MFGKGLRLTRIYGIEIWIDYSWLIIFILLLWSLSVGFFPHRYPGYGQLTYYLMGFVAALTLFGSVLLHELSHSYVAKRSGIPVPRITLFIFGGVAQIASEPKDARTEFNIAVAGPVCSLVLAALFFLLSRSPTLRAAPPVTAVFEYLAYVNTALALFNLIPGFPLDGGRILRAYLWNRWRDLRRATYTVSRIGSWFGIALIVLGGINVLMGDLIGGMWFIFIGMFLNSAAKSGYQMTLLKDALEGVKVSDIMTANVVAVPPYITVSELVRDYFYPHIFVSFPVVSDSGQFLGMVSIKQIRKIPQQRWSETVVADITVPEIEIETLAPADEALRAMELLTKNPLGRVPVTVDGRLVGIVSRRDVMTLLTIRTNLGV